MAKIYSSHLIYYPEQVYFSQNNYGHKIVSDFVFNKFFCFC